MNACIETQTRIMNWENPVVDNSCWRWVLWTRSKNCSTSMWQSTSLKMDHLPMQFRAQLQAMPRPPRAGRNLSSWHQHQIPSMAWERHQNLHSSIPYLIHLKALSQCNWQLTSKGWNMGNLKWKQDSLSPKSFLLNE